MQISLKNCYTITIIAIGVTANKIATKMALRGILNWSGPIVENKGMHASFQKRAKKVPETLKYWVGVQRGQSYLMGRRCLFSLGWQPF